MPFIINTNNYITGSILSVLLQLLFVIIIYFLNVPYT